MALPSTTTVSRPRAWGYDGSINTLLIRLAVSPNEVLEEATAPTTPPKVDTSQSADDIRDETGQRYSRNNLSGGAGLDFLHRMDRLDSDALRFWDSKGVDVFHSQPGSIYSAKLMHDIIQDTALGDSFLRVLTIGDTLYYIADAEVFEYESTLKSTLTTAATDAVSYRGMIYAILATSKDLVVVGPGAWTEVSVDATVNWDRIWVVKDRIVGAAANELYEVALDGAETLCYSAPTGVTITDVVELDEAVLVFQSNGNIEVLTLNDTLVLAPVGRTRFIGEIPVAAAVSQGILGFATATDNEAGGTVVRFYTATLGDSYELVGVQQVFQLGDREDTQDYTPHTMLATRDSIYMACADDGDEVTLWRYFLPTAGYARAHTFEFGSALSVDSLVLIEDRMWAGVPTDGLWKEQDTYVSTGYLIGPLADFFTAEAKQWISSRLTAETIPQGTQLELFDTTNPSVIEDASSGNWLLATKLKDGGTTVETQNLAGRSGQYHAAKLVWTANSGRTSTPAFRSYSFRGIANPDRDVLLRLPINVSDQFESTGKRQMVKRGRGKEVAAAIRAFEGEQVLCTLYNPDLVVRGTVERIETGWQVLPSSGSPTKVMFVTIRGKRMVSDDGTTGNGTLGSVQLGVAQLGV